MTELTVVTKPKKAATIRKRVKAEAPISDAMNTPGWLSERLGRFHFDPCSNPRSVIQADWSFSLEKGIDGLKMRWIGDGYMNFPYSLPLPWCDKLHVEFALEHCTSMVTLCKLDTSTAWWHSLTRPHPLTGATPEIWPFKKRIEYDEPAELTAERHRLHYERKTLRDAAKRAGASREELRQIKVPPLETSNNFCSVIVHHRGFNGKRLDLADVATLWIQP